MVVHPCPPLLEPVLRALAPSLTDVVLVGGWAHQLHRLHPDASPIAEAPLTTNDCDLAVPARLPDPGIPTLAQRLEEEGFRAVFIDDMAQGIAKYELRSDPNFQLEFITPRLGDGQRSGGRGSAKWEVSGVQAETLRYVSLAFIQPWRCALEVEGAGQYELLVVHPVPFLFGKLLVSRAADRPSTSQAKDLFYVVETLQMFMDVLGDDDFQAIRDEAWRALPPRWQKQLQSAVRLHFGQEPDQPGETLVDATAIGATLGRTRMADTRELRSIGRYGVGELFRDLLAP